MTDEREIWPKKIGRGWNTSDKLRFFSEEEAVRHQERVDDPEDEAGTHNRAPHTGDDADEFNLPEEDA